VPKTTPLPIAEIPAAKAKRGRPRKSEVRPHFPLPNGDHLVQREQQAGLRIGSRRDFSLQEKDEQR
jgi:hypothetical protein